MKSASEKEAHNMKARQIFTKEIFLASLRRPSLSTDKLSALAPEFVPAVQPAPKCKTCRSIIKEEDFKTPIDKKEFSISGMCMKCQDEVFGSTVSHNATTSAFKNFDEFAELDNAYGDLSNDMFN